MRFINTFYYVCKKNLIMKNKSLLLLLCALCIVFSVFSAEVNVEKARLVAKNFYFEKANLYHSGIAFNDVVLDETFTKTTGSRNDYYIFTLTGKGYVIVAAEDVLQPVIGYSFDSEYKDQDQPDSYRNFIQTYRDAIQFIRENNIEQSGDVKTLWEYYSANDPGLLNNSPKAKSVDPLVQCKWNQSYPYNVYCPADPGGSGGYVYAGCVATAMAQVMYYWRYPLQGIGSHTYYYPPYGNLTANFGATNYQWEGMQNSIDHEYPGPIAELQYHCGVAVDMMYGPNGSGAYSTDVPPALINYFGYSPDCYFSWKDDHSNTEWVNMLKENIDNSWPMYYSGYSSAGGHAFVCDGYQDEYFHFNFGWGGSSDGYYTLLSVNGFNEGQGAVLNTYPESNYPYYCTGDHLVTIKSGSITDGSGPINNYENNVNCSWLFTPQTGGDSISSVKIVFRTFETAQNDIVTIYNGPTIQNEVLGSFSGSDLPPVITSTSNEVLVVFVSDGSGTAKGWLAEFTAITPDFCKGVVEFEDYSGSFSDGSADFNYQNTTICMWKIIPPQAQSVTLNFTAFNTEPNIDRVRVYDLESQELLADYSGSYPGTNLPAPVTSASGKMFIAFSTNASITASGWEANWVAVTTGIDNSLQSDSKYRVFPNPAKDRIKIEFPEDQSGNINIKLISLTGVTVIDKKLTGDDLKGFHHLDITDVPEGIYLLQITGNSVSETKRIVIQ
jgi:hypothetical protein